MRNRSAASHHVRRPLKSARKGDPLTPREWQVLTLMTQGMENKVIARYFGISARTVEIHRARIVVKLGARTSLNAAIIALVHGITSLDAEVHAEEQPTPRTGQTSNRSMADAAAWVRRGGKLGLPQPDMMPPTPAQRISLTR